MIQFLYLQLNKTLDIFYDQTFGKKGKKLKYALFSEKDIPSRFLDEERYSKQASSSEAPVSRLLIICFF